MYFSAQTSLRVLLIAILQFRLKADKATIAKEIFKN